MESDRKALMNRISQYEFMLVELGLYLDTHCDDKEALEMYTTYVDMSREGRRMYEEKFGPLQQTSVTNECYSWLKNPWPWDYEKGMVK